MVTTGLWHVWGVQWASAGAVNSLFPILSTWKSGSSRERQRHFWMLSHSLLRIMDLLRIALQAPQGGDGHQQVTAKRSHGHVPMCGLWHGLTTTMLTPGFLRGRGRWWSSSAWEEKNEMHSKHHVKAHQLWFLSLAGHNAENTPPLCACPGMVEVSSSMCGRAGHDRDCGVGLRSQVTIHFPLSVHQVKEIAQFDYVWPALRGQGAHGRAGGTKALAFLKHKVPKWFPHGRTAPQRQRDTTSPAGEKVPTALAKLAPGTEMPRQNEHFLILVTIRNRLFSSPSGPICLLRLLMLQKTRKSHYLPVQHWLQEASFLCGAFGHYHNPNHKCHFCVYLLFPLIFPTLWLLIDSASLETNIYCIYALPWIAIVYF